MLPERLRSLPYLVHTNRELGLMLRGIKPLAYFSYILGDEPHHLLRYLRMFDRNVDLDRIIKLETTETYHAGYNVRRIFYALPGEEWRIDALVELLSKTAPWSQADERRFGELLGYTAWQNDHWLRQMP